MADGETSGTCVQAVGIERMRIGVQITLKSGNFGTIDFFTKAFAGLTP